MIKLKKISEPSVKSIHHTAPMRFLMGYFGNSTEVYHGRKLQKKKKKDFLKMKLGI